MSYVVNNGPRPVSHKTRARVQQAIDELDYRPNGMARALRSQRSRTLGLVLPNANNTYFREFSVALESAALARGYVILMMHLTDDEERNRSYLQVLLEHGVDGILAMVEPGSTHAHLLLEADTTVHLTDTADRDVSNEAAAFAATQHLLGHGHAAVAYLGGPSTLALANDRRRGWERALQQARVPKRNRLSVESDYTREGGYEAARVLLAGRPTAALAFNDEQALGLLRAAFELGIDVPGQLAVFGFDATRDSEYSIPSLSSVRTPLSLVADRALDRLLLTRDHTPTSPLPFELVLRQSCGCHQTPGQIR